MMMKFAPSWYTFRGIMVPMTRTNIEIDDDLVREVMQRYGLHSKRAAVDLALRRLVGESMTLEGALAMEGAGWEGDLDKLRQDRRLVRPQRGEVMNSSQRASASSNVISST
jgi:Arc/MetJ family transcription regulator